MDNNSATSKSDSRFVSYNNSNIYNKSQPDSYNVNLDDVKSLFEKRYAYKQSFNWNLPVLVAKSISSYQFDMLQELKINLNSVKSKLNDYKIEDWSAHTRRRNPAGEIPWKIKNIIKAEFVTQAWCKFYECASQYNLVIGPKLNTIHLCEAPGAFISAINHYLHANYNLKAFDLGSLKSIGLDRKYLESNEKNSPELLKWNYFGTTLNPYHESNPLSNMVMDDRFMLHTLENWLFGKDFTGNIIDKDNINDMVSKIKQKMERVDLITADGSIDCMDKPDIQEEIVGKLHYAEVCAAFNILSDNGNFLLKMFTLFEANSVCLVYFLNCCFREVHVFKPATSKSGNSEIYLICLGLNRNVKHFENYLNFMMDNLNTDFILFQKDDIPKDFLMQHEICCRMFMSYQINVIESNIKTYLIPNVHDIKRCKYFRQQVVDYYFKLYKIIPLPKELKMLYIKNAELQYDLHSKRMYSGSYSERNAIKNMTETEKLANLYIHLMDFEKFIRSEKIIQENINKFDDDLTIKLYYGKPVTKIESSLFFNIHLLNLRNKIEKVLTKSQKLETYNCELFNDLSIIQVINFHSKLDNDNFGNEEKIFFKNIIKVCVEENINTIIFNKFPILTHFSASVIKFLWKYIFNNLTIKYNKYQIIFEDKKINYKNHLVQLNDILLDSDNLFCLIDIKELHQNLFNNIIVNYNNSLFFKNFKNILCHYSS